jgi:hypothetical protein
MVIEPTFSLERGYPVLTISDTVTTRPLGRTLYRMDNARLEICQSTTPCDRTTNRATIGVNLSSASGDYTWEVSGNTLLLKQYGQSVLSIDASGNIEKTSSIDLSLNTTDTTKNFMLDIQVAGNVVGSIQYMMDSEQSVVQTDDVFASSARNTPVLSVYGYQAEVYSSQAFSSSVSGYRVSRDGGAQAIDTTTTGPDDISSFGEIQDVAGVGWQDSNRTLLSYSAGDTVGESTKWFHTYTLINIGDPVAHVTQGRVGTQVDGMDRTVGTQITDGRHASIVDYFHKDMNHDGVNDLLVQYSDGYIELFLNLGGKFRSRGYIAYLPHIGNQGIQFADFQHDGYADIVTVDQSGSLSLISNQDRRFTNTALTIQ